jgi:hypothetical protein
MTSINVEQLRRQIQIILKDADLNTLSSKKVRQMLETFFQCDFTERKKEIDDILMGEITMRETMPLPVAHDDQQTATDTCQRDNSSLSHDKSTDRQGSTVKSDEELAMEIHQQENRPSLRQPVVSHFGWSHISTEDDACVHNRKRTTTTAAAVHRNARSEDHRPAIIGERATTKNWT